MILFICCWLCGLFLYKKHVEFHRNVKNRKNKEHVGQSALYSAWCDLFSVVVVQISRCHFCHFFLQGFAL